MDELLHAGLTLKDRTFECDSCGHAEDRDPYAFRNLERYPGLQWSPYASGHPSAGRLGKLTGETRVKEVGILQAHEHFRARWKEQTHRNEPTGQTGARPGVAA